MMPPSAQKRDTRAIAALLALSFLWSLGSLRADLLPYNWQGRTASTLIGQALRLAALAIEAALIARITRSRRVRRSATVSAALIGLGLFALPALTLYFAAPFVSDLTRTALFSLALIFAVLFEPYLGRANAPQSRTALLAALIGVSGTLCLFSIDMPGSPQTVLAFFAVVLLAAAVAAVNCYAVRIASIEDAPSPAATAAVATAGAALALGVASAAAQSPTPSAALFIPDLLWTTLIDLPALLLLFWLMHRMTAARMTLRFLLAPLLTGILGLALYRPPVGLRSFAGLALMALGAAWMLLARDEVPEATESTLHLE
jgi:drug/metabolite transporter (DMT)-like permease